jgi:hypothetical protein
MAIECVNQFLEKKPFAIKDYTYQYPTYVFSLEDAESHETLDVALADQCHELYLEQNIYSYGEAPTGKVKEDYQFDTFNRHIYFDQNLVTNSDINEWVKYDHTESTQGLKVETIGNNLFLPSTHLTLKQMQNYCSFKGKQLMSAHIYDAATFLTQEKTRSTYYWTKKRNDVKVSCDLVFFEECLAEKKWRANSSSPSWAGLHDSLGGVMEAFRNPVDSESNLKASSFYFPQHSPWHRLGFRAHWDGEANSLRNFDFKGLGPQREENSYQVGFRCMREVAQ